MAKLRYNAKVYEGTTAELAADTTIYQANDFIYNTTTGELKKGNGVDELADLDPIGGGAGGPVTVTSNDITDATTVGKALIKATNAAAGLSALGAAPLAAPTFTGDAKAATPAVGNSSVSIATTAFVLTNAGKNKAAIAALVSPTADYADLTAATAAIKSVIDALKA